MKKILIFGHKNPDTDSIVSSTALEYFKRQMGFSNYCACRSGQLNPQTDYLYKKFDFPSPLFVPDLMPKVEYFMHKGAITVLEQESIWNAINIMREHKVNALPVTDRDGFYKGLLSNDLIFNGLFESVTPMHHISLFTSALLLKETLNGEFLSEGNKEALEEFKIISASTSFDSFSKTLSGPLLQQ